MSFGSLAATLNRRSLSPTDSFVGLKEADVNSQSPSLKKPLLPISHEIDLLGRQHRGKPDVDRSDWLQRVIDKNPDIQELRESVNPVVRACSFARLYLPTNRMISHELLLSLVSQHLRTLGLSETQASLHSEWGSDFKIPPHKLYSQLAILIQRGVHRAEKFWELAIPSIHACESVKATQTRIDEEISSTIGSAPNVFQDTAPLKEETPGDERFVKYEKNTGEPVEASLNQLIFWLTTSESPTGSDGENMKDPAEITNALVLTISSYASSKIFLKKLKDRWDMIKEEMANSQSTGERSTKIPNDMLFVKLFKAWVQGSINDMEPQILEEAMQFTEQEMKPKYAMLVNKIFESKNAGGAARLKQLESLAPEIDLGKDCNGLWKGTFQLLDLPAIEFARQLTVWSCTKYYAIKRCELLDCAWDKPRLRWRAPNVIALTQHYCRLSQWVEYSILSEKSLSRRKEKMEKLIQVADYLFNERNYFDAMGILSGFDSNSLFRCTVHISLLSAKAQDTLEKLRNACNTEGNFKNLRQMYDQATSQNKPALPYIGVLLSDLFKYYDATQTFCDGLINVRKCKGVYKMISKIEEFMRTKYNLLPIDQVQAKIDELKDYEEDTLISMSWEIEPDGATPDTLLDIPEP